MVNLNGQANGYVWEQISQQAARITYFDSSEATLVYPACMGTLITF